MIGWIEDFLSFIFGISLLLVGVGAAVVVLKLVWWFLMTPLW